MVNCNFAFTRQSGWGVGGCASLTFVQAIDSMELCLVVLSCFNALY